MNLLQWWWFIPLVCLGLLAFAYFAPRKEDRALSGLAGPAFVPGEPLRVSVSSALLTPAKPEPAEAVPPPDTGSAEDPPPERTARERLAALQHGDRDRSVLRALLVDDSPAIRSAALDIALDWDDLDAVQSAIADPVIPIAARASLEYAARTSQATCEAELDALDPAHAARIRERLAVMAF